MRVLARYVAERILSRFVLILVTVVAFTIAFELMDRADNILNAHDGDYGAVLRYAAFKLPGLITDFGAVALLMASLLALGDLLRHRELVASWDIGISPWMLMKALLPLGLILGVGQAGLGEWAVPAASRGLTQMGFADEREGLFRADGEGPLWIQEGGDIMRIAPGKEGAAVGMVSVFRRNAEGIMSERLDAAGVTDDGTSWQLLDVVRRRVSPSTSERIERLDWPRQFDLHFLGLLSSSARTLPLRDLIHIVLAGNTGSRSPSLYLTWAIHRTLSPLVPALMICLAVALARRFERTGGLTRLLLTGGGLGFAFFILDQTALALSEVGAVPAWIGAPAAFVTLIVIIAALLRHGNRLPRRRIVHPRSDTVRVTS